ncbi:MAG: 16S rRNA processing protein RimM [Candidatus Marinimicrobia bacterium]|nr:16S rRNA processing protein RimM [Candidatus Neomarinimicrobiota bacterium]
MNNTESKRYIQLGRIVKPHGLRGDTKIVLFNSSSRTLESNMTVRLENEGGDKRDVRISNVRYTPKFAIVQFEEYDTVEEVETLRGYMLSVERSMFPSLSDDDYYLTDLIGFSVHDVNGENYGSVKKVMNYPANDVLIMDYENREILIPIVDEFIKLIDFEKQIVTVNLIEGLLEI